MIDSPVRIGRWFVINSSFHVDGDDQERTIAVAYTPNGERLYMTGLDWWADVATIVALLLVVSGSGGAVAWLVNRYRFRQKSKAVEEYLRREKAEKTDYGQRTARNIRRYVEQDLTDEEIYKISRHNPKIKMRVRPNRSGLADKDLFEYMSEE